MKVVIIFLVLFLYCCRVLAADSLVVSSPDKRITVTVQLQKKLSYSIKYLDELILQPSYIDLLLDNGQLLTTDLRVQRKSIKQVNERIVSPVPEKRKEIADHYNQLSLEFKKPFTLLVRVYNDGVAYRLVTRFKDSVIIKNELAQFNFNPGKKLLLPIILPRENVDQFHTSFEELYQLKSVDSLSESTLAYSPVLASAGDR